MIVWWLVLIICLLCVVISAIIFSTIGYALGKSMTKKGAVRHTSHKSTHGHSHSHGHSGSHSGRGRKVSNTSRTSADVASLASKQLRDEDSTKDEKSVAASALENRRKK